MRWSWQAGRLAGIPVRIHVTFALLVGFVGFAHWTLGGASALGAGLALVGGLFGSVLLHELGHALAARRYGIATHDIVLLPIGGVARLERMPARPGQEIAVALAGPAVNVAIAAALFTGLALGGRLEPLSALGVASGSLVERLMLANLGLVAFNLLPVFPLDGGRVLRGLLALRLPHARATRVAARIGRAGAVVLGVYGLFGNPFLVLIAVFVWMAARQEEAEASRPRAWRVGSGEPAEVRVEIVPGGPSAPSDRVARGAGRPSRPVVLEVVAVRRPAAGRARYRVMGAEAVSGNA